MTELNIPYWAEINPTDTVPTAFLAAPEEGESLTWQQWKDGIYHTIDEADGMFCTMAHNGENYYEESVIISTGLPYITEAEYRAIFNTGGEEI